MIHIAKLTASAALFMYSSCLAGADNPQSPAARENSRHQRSTSELVGRGNETALGNTDGAFGDDVAYEEHEFVHRINSLINALTDFATSYHAGNVIDVKKARAVRKALRELTVTV